MEQVHADSRTFHLPESWVHLSSGPQSHRAVREAEAAEREAPTFSLTAPASWLPTTLFLSPAPPPATRSKPGKLVVPRVGKSFPGAHSVPGLGHLGPSFLQLLLGPFKSFWTFPDPSRALLMSQPHPSAPLLAILPREGGRPQSQGLGVLLARATHNLLRPLGPRGVQEVAKGATCKDGSLSTSEPQSHGPTHIGSSTKKTCGQSVGQGDPRDISHRWGTEQGPWWHQRGLWSWEG